MNKETAKKILNTHFFSQTVLIVIVVSILVAFVSIIKLQDPDAAAIKKNSSSSIPHVTETDQFYAYLRTMLDTYGPESVQVQLRELYADEEHGEQHMAFHYLGEVLYSDIGANALPQCENWYGFGCYHGLLLAAINTEGYQVVPALDEACLQAHSYLMDVETCQHGIGHGLLEFSGRDPIKAIEACALLDDVYPKLGCASGVFMEYFAPTQDENSRVRQAPVYEENDPFNVCDEFTGVRLATCLFEIHGWWPGAALFPSRTVEILCNSVEDQEAREFCLIGYGNSKGPVIEDALPYCDEFVVPESHALCRAGILWSAEHFYDPQDTERACNDLEGEYSALCFEKGRFTCEVEGNCRL